MFKKTSSARIYNLSLHDALPIFPNAKTEQPKGTKSFFFPYQPAMKVGTLEVEGVASKGEKSKASPRMPVATGIITTSKLVKPVYFAAYSDHGYNNQEELVPVIIPDFIFEQGRSVLRTSEIKSTKGKELDAFIASKNATRTVRSEERRVGNASRTMRL